MSQDKFKIELGTKVRDKVTSFTGIVIAQTRWLYGCRRYTVQPHELKDGKPIDALSFDEDALDLIEKPVVPDLSRNTGGPTREPQRTRDASRT